MNQIKLHKKPEIITIGKRQQIATGEFNLELVLDKILTDGTDDWLSVSDLAKFVYGNAFKDSMRRVRAQIWRVRKELLLRPFLLLTEGRPIQNVKIFVGGDFEQQIALPLVRKMRSRSDISADLYERALALVSSQHDVSSRLGTFEEEV